MNIGKIIAGIFSAVAVLLIVYLMNTGTTTLKDESKPSLAPKNTDFTPKASQIATNNMKESEDLNKVLELQKSVENSQNEGVSKLYLVSCAPCHAKNGDGIIAPSIKGKSKEELLKSLQDYKADKVPNSLMRGLLTNTSDENLELLADEISKFK